MAGCHMQGHVPAALDMESIDFVHGRLQLLAHDVSQQKLS